MPCIKIPSGDILVVDRIGKNISGDGMDPNISGTWATPMRLAVFSLNMWSCLTYR